MKNWALLAVASLAIALAGCVSHAKPALPKDAVPPNAGAVAEPAPAPEPLSAPQTHIQLPPEQPLDQEALVLEHEQKPPNPPPTTQATNPAPATVRRTPPPANAANSNKPEPTPAVVEPVPTQRPPIQEALPDNQRAELLGRVSAKRK